MPVLDKNICLPKAGDVFLSLNRQLFQSLEVEKSEQKGETVMFKCLGLKYLSPVDLMEDV